MIFVFDNLRLLMWNCIDFLLMNCKILAEELISNSFLCFGHELYMDIDLYFCIFLHILHCIRYFGMLSHNTLHLSCLIYSGHKLSSDFSWLILLPAIAYYWKQGQFRQFHFQKALLLIIGNCCNNRNIVHSFSQFMICNLD